MLPVIELRLDTFSGTDTTWNKVNFHVIFSNELDAEDIRAHFLSSLEVKHSLWHGKIVDRRTLAEFGKRIIESIPEHKRHGSYTPEIVAYHHLTFNLKDLQRYLTATVFENKHLVAVGKAEWANMRWETAIADKRTIVDGADIVFTAAGSPDACHKAQRRLWDEGVTAPLLDCSDAHYPLDSTQKDRLGHCYTWLKADTTFAGLRQVLNNPSGRIYLGDKPDKLTVVEQQPTKFIKSVSINKKAGSRLDETWFANTIEFNYDFVAIIGNKGMGKSALADILALTSNSDAPSAAYGFLDKRHFRDEENKAAHFTATTTWHAGPSYTKNLDDHVEPPAVPLVRYIPQHHFEDLCNETATAGRLQSELQKVIYSHLDETETFGHATLQELIDDRTSAADRQIIELRARLQEVNDGIIALERSTTAAALATLLGTLALQQQALDVHLAAEPTPVAPPTAPAGSPALDAAVLDRRRQQVALDDAREQLRVARGAQAAATNLEARLKEFSETAERLARETRDAFTLLELKYDDVLQITINTALVRARREMLDHEVSVADQRQASLQAELAELQQRIATITDTLDEPNRLYQRYLADRRTWEEHRDALVGSEHATGSITELTARIDNFKNAGATKLDRLRAERANISTRIHEQQLEKAAFQRGLYARLQQQLNATPFLAAKLPLEFNAALIDTGFASTFNEFIKHNVEGAFSDEDAVGELLRMTNINEPHSLAKTLDRVMTLLLDAKDIDNIERQRKKGASVERIYNFIYGLEYLDVRYSLRIKGRELLRLTPGERGSVLLVFYLLADKDERPLIIDQPEENLDNQSVYELVVPCIKEAKKRRQIIMVTHNPNLAVVCDAEQLIWCDIDKENKNTVTYRTGSIENPAMNRHVVDVLEGTWRAFSDRGKTYHEQ